MVITDDEEDAGSENEYELGSFVCDDEDVSFDSESIDLLSRSRALTLSVCGYRALANQAMWRPSLADTHSSIPK